MNTKEQFLDFEIKLAGQLLGVEFRGSTLDDKVNFYNQFKEDLRIATDKMLTEMYTAYNAKVIRFGDGISETDWVVAESIEQAFKYYKDTTMRSDIDMSGLESEEISTQIDFMLFEAKEVPTEDRGIFKESTQCEGYLEVPFVYAIDYALQNGMKLPSIIQSFE